VSSKKDHEGRERLSVSGKKQGSTRESKKDDFLILKRGKISLEGHIDRGRKERRFYPIDRIRASDEDRKMQRKERLPKVSDSVKRRSSPEGYIANGSSDS